MDKKKVVFFIILGVVITLLFGLIMFHQLKHGDFPAHINWAREYSENGYLYKIPHTLFAKLVTVVRALLPANILVWISPMAKQIYDIKAFEISTLIVMVLSYLFAGLIIVQRLIHEWEVKEKKWLYFAGLAALTIMIVAPIFIFTFPDRMFLGYIMGNRYDSPTYILSKPFVLLMFIGIVDCFFDKWNWKQAFIMVFAVLCATLAKPSFTITIIPAIGLVILLNIKKFKKVNWAYFFVPLGFTAAIVLISQFIINYSGDRGDRIIIAPFESILYYVPNLFLVILFVLLSIVFPLLVTIQKWKDVKHKTGFQLAWMNFIVAMGYALIFAEEINLAVNNFWNGAMIAVFVLFFVSVSYWGGDIAKKIYNKQKLTSGQIVSGGALGIHLICGIIYFIAILTSNAVMVN